MNNNDLLNLSMFKAYDIRTPAKDLTSELAKRLTLAEAYYFREVLKTNRVVLCRDARSSGEHYLEIGKEIFLKLGFEVLVVPEIRSTCHFYYCCMRHTKAAGIMYGASHNPGGDTGQKLVAPGVMPIAESCGPQGGLDKIKELYIDSISANVLDGGSVESIDYIDDYIAYSMNLAGVASGDFDGCSILMDFLHGAAGDEFIRAFKKAGATVDARHALPDGSFPAGPPNPVIPESIASSLDALRNGSYNFGLFFDGDGDRIDFYSTDGDQLSPAANMSIIAVEIHKILIAHGHNPKNPGIYACLKASPYSVQKIAQKLSCRLIRNGHSQIKQALADTQTEGCLAAVEESAHYYMNFPFNGNLFATENTLFFGLLTAKHWLQEPGKYSQAINDQHRIYREREWGYRFPTENSRADALAAVEREFVKNGGWAISKSLHGMALDATLMRKGLPKDITGKTEIPNDWIQIAQRISQSEKGLARWEVSAGSEKLKAETTEMTKAIISQYTTGEPYIG